MMSEHSDADDYEESYAEKCEILSTQLCDRIYSISNYGDFACMTQYSQHINPGLEVAGSPIPLPLVERDATTIKSKGKEAPCGRGDDTVADGSGAKDWQIDFRCSNPAWPAFLDTVVREAFQKLGINHGKARAVPSKLVFSEEGSPLRLHNDSEELLREKIGTIVIILPSRYEGGESRFSHGQKSHAFATADSSGFDLTVLAWYSDVTHEIGPVTSGNRLVMTYHLMCGGLNPPPSAANMERQQTLLQEALKAWACPLRTDTKAVYMLNHVYSASSLSIKNLRGRDSHIIRCVDQACQETGFYLLLAMASGREERRLNEYHVPEVTLELDCITTVEGDNIARSIVVHGCNTLNRDPRWSRSAYTVKESDSDDNESIASDEERQESALLIVSSETLFDLIKSPRVSAAKLLQMVCLSDAVSPREANEIDKSRVIRFLARVSERFGSIINGVPLLRLFLAACKLWSPQELYYKAVRKAVIEALGWNHDDSSSQSSKTDSIESSESLITDSLNFTLANIAEIVSEIVDTSISSHTMLQEFDEYFGELAGNPDLPTESLDNSLATIEENLSKKLQDPFRCWRSSISKRTFETRDLFTVHDLYFIWRLIDANPDEDEWITTRLVPKLVQCADRELLYSLIQGSSARDDHSALKSKSSPARQLLEATLPKLRLEIGDFEPDLRQPSRGPGYHYLAIPGSGNDLYANAVFKLPKLFRSCFKCGLEEQGMDLLKHTYTSLEEGITRSRREKPGYGNTRPGRHEDIPEAWAHCLGRQFLDDIIDTLQQHMETPPIVLPGFVKNLFLLLFKRYIRCDEPGAPPDEPTTWSHKPSYCAGGGVACNSCAVIQKFILAADMESTILSCPKKMRLHLQNMLPKQHYTCKRVPGREKGSGLHLLKVTKRSLRSEHEEAKEIYDREVQEYRMRLFPFRKPIVQRLLGDDTYKVLIMLEPPPLQSDILVSGAKRGASESPDQRASTRQRTGDVAN